VVTAALHQALEALRRGRDGDAEALLAGATAEGTDAIVEGILWMLCRRPEASTRALRRAVRSTQGSLRALALRTQSDLCGGLGWNHEARAALEEWVRLRPDALAPRRRLVDLLARGHAWEDAADVLAGASDRMPLRVASVLRELGRHDEATARLLALRTPTTSVGGLRRLADLLGKNGAVAEAIEVLEGADEATPETLADRARLALWLGQGAQARSLAEAALAHGASGDALDRAEMVLAVCTLTDGGTDLAAVQPDSSAARDARDALTRVLDRAPLLGEALVWRGHAHAVLGQSAEALADLDAGVPAVGGFDLGAALLRHLVEQRISPSPGFGRRSLSELAEGLARAGIPRERAYAIRTVSGLEEAFGHALRTLGGNRSGHGTVLGEDGRARALGPTLSPRSDARRALELIRIAGPESVLAEFTRVQARWPESSMGVVHRAELLLWMGRYEEARVAFEEALAINYFTRWGWIGQLANESFLGDPERALELGEEGVRVMGGYGPSHFVYRGEALLRLGRLGEARPDLEYAVQLGPSRMGARVTLAMLCAETGDDAGVAAHMPALRQACPSMLAVALEEEGAPSRLIWGDAPSAGALLPVLRRAHRMMRGNRSSSCHTWFSDAGTLRVNEDRGKDGDPFRERMHDRLEQAAAILGGGSGG
jgi:tetratricopeptide (TPR) repeat protein